MISAIAHCSPTSMAIIGQARRKDVASGGADQTVPGVHDTRGIFPTNRSLSTLLRETFRLRPLDVYATDLFPFVKPV
ncbi:MAG: hypothetical protein PVSMB1_13140 [Gemmatimonadaceae bacterium]